MTKEQIKRKNKITHIPLSKIIPNTDQPRRSFDAEKLSELAASIRENGLLQPITVRPHGREYMLIAGERRLRASHIAGLTSIPCIVVEVDDRESATLALLENLQRDDLDFFEEAEAISRLMRKCGYTQEVVAKKLGKSQSAISNKLRLLRLGTDICEGITKAKMTERHARALLRLTTREERSAALAHIIKHNLNVPETDEYIEAMLARKESKRPSKKSERYVIKDMRLFYNSVTKALDTMRRAGFRADMARNENDEYIDMSIRIFK